MGKARALSGIDCGATWHQPPARPPDREREEAIKLSLKGGTDAEHVRIHNDSLGCGFLIHISGQDVHIRAKAMDEPDAKKTTLVLETICEVTK